MTEQTASTDPTIIYTHTDEAPLLATYSLLPIIRRSPARPASRSRPATSRWPAGSSPQFPDLLTEDQRIDDALAELGAAGHDARGQHHQAAEHLSASIPQLRPPSPSCRSRATPSPTTPTTRRPTRSRTIRARYDKVKGSAVNPVLREGNSDRRAPASVKSYARKHPHSMGAWSRRLQDQRRAHGRRRLPLQREVGRSSTQRRLAAHRARRRRRHDDRAQGDGAGARRRDRRRHRDAGRRAATRSSPRRSPAPRPRACCSRCTSRPR